MFATLLVALSIVLNGISFSLWFDAGQIRLLCCQSVPNLQTAWELAEDAIQLSQIDLLANVL
jgi:hypothetical protein